MAAPLHQTTPASTASSSTHPFSVSPILAYSEVQPSSGDQLISAIHVQHRHETYSSADEPGYRDCGKAGAPLSLKWASNPNSDGRQTSADTPPEPAVRNRQMAALLYSRTHKGYGGHYMDLPAQDPRGIFCLHSVPCCSGPFDDAGRCISSGCGGYCSCNLPMPLERQ